MAMRLSSEVLKPKLSELANSSEALKTISREERNKRIALMMSAPPEDMLRYIGVFEEELKALRQIEAEAVERAEEVKRLKLKETRARLEEMEKISRKEDNERAEKLLEQLGGIA